MDSGTIERIRRNLDNPEIGPETIAFMVTRICNFNCIYCRGGRAEGNVGGTDISDELTTEQIFSFLDDAYDFLVKEINLGGMYGEPFCKKDILKIIQKIKQLGFMGSMTTNGSFLNARIAAELTDCSWDIVLLSFDSHQESIQHTTRPAFNKKPYLHNIIEFFDALKYKRSRLRVLLNVVITKFNYNQLPQLVEFANRYDNIESINVLRMLNIGLKEYNRIQLNQFELEEFKLILSSLHNEKKITYQGNWLDLKNDCSASVQMKTAKCFTNYYILSVDSNGDILTCPQYQNKVYDLNIKTIPLKQLWLNGHLKYRQALVQNAPCFEGCCTILKEQNKLIADSMV